MDIFNYRKSLVLDEYEKLVTRKNTPIEGNGIYNRYQHPVLTAAMVPPFWKYDFNPATNPFFMERIGCNAVLNSGAIKLDGKYLLVVRVEGADRKSFFAVAESPNGVDNFRFWNHPITMPEDTVPGTNVYDMRLTQHEDGWIYGLFCVERHDDSQPGDLSAFQSTLGRTAIRQIETMYVADLMVEWVNELMEAIKGGDSEYFRAPERTTGEGSGFWEAPRGALYHSEKVKDGKIEGYQIIIPSTWNLAPINGAGDHGPLEQALIGVPVADIEKPINALRTVHSFDPCTACAVHVTDRATGKSFETVTSPWGVK